MKAAEKGVVLARCALNADGDAAVLTPTGGVEKCEPLGCLVAPKELGLGSRPLADSVDTDVVRAHPVGLRILPSVKSIQFTVPAARSYSRPLAVAGQGCVDDTPLQHGVTCKVAAPAHRGAERGSPRYGCSCSRQR